MLAQLHCRKRHRQRLANVHGLQQEHTTANQDTPVLVVPVPIHGTAAAGADVVGGAGTVVVSTHELGHGR